MQYVQDKIVEVAKLMRSIPCEEWHHEIDPIVTNMVIDRMKHFHDVDGFDEMKEATKPDIQALADIKIQGKSLESFINYGELEILSDVLFPY